MKKKIKLISTFASLGLALALMVFGVYAATSASFKVTTNVSFTATQHVKAIVSVRETGKLNAAPQEADYGDAVTAGINVNVNGETTGDFDENDHKDFELTGATLDAQNVYYGYEVTIENLDKENELPVAITAADKEGTQYTVTFTGEDATKIAAATESANGKIVITCVIQITDLAGNAVEVDAADLELNVDLGA